MKIFKTPVSANYNPVTMLTFALNYQNGKLDPYGYHLENVIFHLLDTILVFLFIFLLPRRNLLMASIVALFFGIHPMHVESVSWISERKDVLYVFFFLAGLITYLRYSETRKIIWYLFTFLFFLLSCLSKGMAVVFPVILLLIDYLRDVKWKRSLLIEKIPFFLLSLVFGIIAIKIQQSAQAIIAAKVLTIFQRLMFASYGAVMYIVKLFVPYKLSALYPYPDISPDSSLPLIFYLSPFILFIIIGALIYFFRKKKKEIVFGLLFYFVSVALVLQFISTGSAVIADRYSYLSYIGLLFAVAYIINKSWQSKSGIWRSLKYPLVIIAIIGAVTLGYRAYSRTQVWKNSETLWTDVVAKYPGAYTAYYNRAIYYSDNHNEENAISDFTKAIAIDSTNATVFSNRGLLYLHCGKDDSAITDFTKAIELAPATADIYSDRGLLYLNKGETNLAMTDFAKAIALDSTDANAFSNRGLLYLRQGKNDSAIADYNKAISLNPNSAFFYYNRGLCYNALNQYEKALDDFTSGIQLHPQSVESFYNMRGLCNVSFQKYNEAISDFSKAIEVNPSVADFWLNRSIAENKIGESESSKADALKAQQLQGNRLRN